MRNGNHERRGWIRKLHMTFLSYLWGMETCLFFFSVYYTDRSYPTYEEWKHSIIPPKCFIHILVLILPMRNGNYNRYFSYSFPTGPVLILPMRNGNLDTFSMALFFYIVLILPMRNGNFNRYGNGGYTISVLILPMRNGNLISMLGIISFTSVLILPMRNGNCSNNLIIFLIFMFLSYLWGMETLFVSMKSTFIFLFLSYLWGMETVLLLLQLFHLL